MKWRGVKIIGWGFVNYAARFLVGGLLLRGVQLNPLGFLFGFLLTLTALLAAYVLLRFIMKPNSFAEAFKISVVWVGIALLLDMLAAQPVMGIPVSYLLTEPQTWTRLGAIIIPTLFVGRRYSSTTRTMES